MNDPLEIPSGHPGWDALLRHHLGELPAAQEERLVAHVAECATCAARLQTLRGGDERFRNERPFAVLEASLRQRRETGAPRDFSRLGGAGAPVFPRKPLPWIAGALAAAGLVAFLALGRPDGSGPVAPGGGEGARERPKATLALSFDVLRDGQAVPGDPARAYHAGDRIQLRYSAPSAANVVVIGLDARGEVTIYADDAGHGLRVEPGAGRPLPGSVVLDDAPDAERLIACFTESDVTSAAVVAAGKRALSAAGGSPRLVGPLDLPCDQADLVLLKE